MNAFACGNILGNNIRILHMPVLNLNLVSARFSCSLKWLLCRLHQPRLMSSSLLFNNKLQFCWRTDSVWSILARISLWKGWNRIEIRKENGSQYFLLISLTCATLEARNCVQESVRLEQIVKIGCKEKQKWRELSLIWASVRFSRAKFASESIMQERLLCSYVVFIPFPDMCVKLIQPNLVTKK